LFRSSSRSSASFSSAARSSLLRRPVNVGLTAAFLPRVDEPRRIAGEAEREGASALFRPPRRWTGGRVGASAPSWGVEMAEAAADDSAEEISTGAAAFASSWGAMSCGIIFATGAAVDVAGAASPASATSPVPTSRPAVAPPLPPPRARVLPLPRGFGGMAVCYSVAVLWG
jgi:hypothetical protein